MIVACYHPSACMSVLHFDLVVIREFTQLIKHLWTKQEVFPWGETSTSTADFSADEVTRVSSYSLGITDSYVLSMYKCRHFGSPTKNEVAMHSYIDLDCMMYINPNLHQIRNQIQIHDQLHLCESVDSGLTLTRACLKVLQLLYIHNVSRYAHIDTYLQVMHDRYPQ